MWKEMSVQGVAQQRSQAFGLRSRLLAGAHFLIDKHGHANYSPPVHTQYTQGKTLEHDIQYIIYSLSAYASFQPLYSPWLLSEGCRRSARQCRCGHTFPAPRNQGSGVAQSAKPQLHFNRAAPPASLCKPDMWTSTNYDRAVEPSQAA